jgi:molecular chaperone DnaJ
MDYYHILGVQSNASDIEIKKAYRELSFKYHPDKHVNASESQKKENDKKIKASPNCVKLFCNCGH